MREIKFRAWDGTEIFIPEAIVNAKDYGSGEYYKSGASITQNFGTGMK